MATPDLPDGSAHGPFMRAFMEQVLTEIGPRPSCREGEHRLARQLAQQWEPLCDRVDVEPFRCQPEAFLGSVWVFTALILVALALLPTRPMVALLCLVAGGVVHVGELFNYRRIIDPMFPTRESTNVLGVLRPKGEVRQRLIVCAHMDSAWEFNLWYWFGQGSFAFMGLGWVAWVALFSAGAMSLWPSLFGGLDYSRQLWWVGVALSPVALAFFAFHTFRPVPGAMDDLAGVAVMHGLLRHLRDPEHAGGFVPQHTEVVLFAAGAEEAGLRGAMAYVERHDAELRALPTSVLVVDGVTEEVHFTVVDREVSTLARHSPRLVALVVELARGRGRDIKQLPIPLGATDASAFTRAGHEAVMVGCQDITRLVPNYHTRLDTLDRVRTEALVTVLELAMDLVERVDRG